MVNAMQHIIILPSNKKLAANEEIFQIFILGNLI